LLRIHGYCPESWFHECEWNLEASSTRDAQKESPATAKRLRPSTMAFAHANSGARPLQEEATAETETLQVVFVVLS
jgi:hypothetical protein